MLFTCPANAARGGAGVKSRGKRRHLCVDVHCHVHYPPADEMVKHAYRGDLEPAARFSSALSRATNQKQMENVRVYLTSVEPRCGSGSWGGQRPSMGNCVTGAGATSWASVAGGCLYCLASPCTVEP